MSISIFGSSKTILLLSDDALYVYGAKKGGTRFFEAIPWKSDNFIKNLSQIISKDCAGRPIVLLNDMAEQHYRKERVVKQGVGFFDRSSVVTRKLAMTFPNYQYRASIALKEKPSQGDGAGLKADLYLFAAAPNSEQIALVMDAIKKSLAPVNGFGMLPFESSDMVASLSSKIFGSKKTRSKWSVFIGQHKSGGLRQIVIKDGELALTRITPLNVLPSDPETWAKDVFQEFKTTMGYISRFGFHPEDGLDIITIVDTMAGEKLEKNIGEQGNYAALSVNEAASALGLNVGRQDEQFSDILHAAWSAKKSSLSLPLQSKEIEEIAKPRKMAMAASLLLLLSAGGLGLYLMGETTSYASVLSDISDSQIKKASLEEEYAQEVKKKEDLGIDIELLRGAIAVNKELEKERIKILSLFLGIGNGLGKDLRFDRIEVKKADDNAFSGNKIAKRLYDNDGKKAQFVASMYMTYPSTTNIDRGNQEVRDLSKRLQGLMPEYNVKVTKYLKDYEYVEEVIVESGDVDKEDIQQDFIAEILITGYLAEDLP